MKTISFLFFLINVAISQFSQDHKLIHHHHTGYGRTYEENNKNLFLLDMLVLLNSSLVQDVSLNISVHPCILK